MTTVLVFGAFDPLHAGHAYFLGRAASLGDTLVVALASDDAIRALKGHEPRATFDARAAVLRMLPLVDNVVTSDASGAFGVIDDVRPDVIALGYDQGALRVALESWMTSHRIVPTVTITAHEPDTYKSSLL